jgi:signal peptidase I
VEAEAPDTTEFPIADTPTVTKPKKKKGHLAFLEWGGLILGAFLIAVVVRAFLFQAFYIPSASMVPTLQKNDRVLVNKLSYKLHDVHRGDIIVFKAPKNVNPPVKDLVKRVIGLPGDTVEGRDDGYVYVNGKRLNEPYLNKPGITTPGFSARVVPADHYWVMGDNRTISEDSRYFGFIPKSAIVGRVFIRIWPLSRIDLL